MTYTREAAIRFWQAFDLAFSPRYGKVSEDVLRAYGDIGSLDLPLNVWRTTRRDGTYPETFRAQMLPFQTQLTLLSNKQLEVFDAHFEADEEAITRAFEDFGQGVLFDDSRPSPDKVHKMDTGGTTSPPVGYHRWHSFIRAAVMVGADEVSWLPLNRRVGLAWAVQSEAKPENDNPNNPGLGTERVQKLRSLWMSLSFDELDSSFDSTPYPAEPPPR